MLYQVMSVDVIVGLQRGDEGKGRFVDHAAENYEVVARGNGGANAGHTVVSPEGTELKLHQLPSGIAYPGKVNVIGSGVYVDPVRLMQEIRDVESKGIRVTPNNLLISETAHVVLPHHKELDELRENGSAAQGSTKAGIAFVAADKYLREGIRTEDIFDLDERKLRNLALEGLIGIFSRIKTDDIEATTQDFREQSLEWAEACEDIKPYLADDKEALRTYLEDNKRILAEGAQAYGLDINQGMYPFVTSSSTTVNGLLDGLGLAHSDVGSVTGVAKMIRSHVGGGPFVTKISDPTLAETIRGDASEVDYERGATTGRDRDVGYLDLVELRTAIEGNGVDQLILSKMDRVYRFGEFLCIAVEYKLDGERIEHAPSSAAKLERCEPVYVEFPTWPDISGVKDYRNLPMEAKDFLDFAQEELDTDISMIGVGPERNQVIKL